MSSRSPPTATLGTATPDTAAHVRSDESHALTSAQAVGVAIGAVSGVIIIFAVIYVLACIRRRRSKRHNAQRQSYDFIDEAPAKHSPSTYESFGSRAPLSGLLAPRSKPTSDKHSTLWPSPAWDEQGELHSRSGFRSQVNTRSSESILSNASIRTVSQLLPERPGSKPPPPPFRSINAPSVQTPAAIFEEDHNAPLPRTMLPGLPAHPAVLKARQPRARETASQPVLSLQIPQQEYPAPSTHNLADWPLPPPPARIASHNDESLSDGSAAFSSSKTSLLDYYASADSGSSPQEWNSPTPIEETTQVRRPAPAAILIAQPSYQPRATRDSVNSDVSRRTSFESTNGDEITPPEEDDKRLSPVAESPISNVRYPRVPRSSNQAVPRSPVYCGTIIHCPPATSSREVMRKSDQNLSMHKPTGSSSTLAARRRGDQLEHLHITNSAYDHRNNSNSAGSERPLCSQRQQSPLKGYGRTKSQPRSAPSHPLTVKTRSVGSLKSPLWEPKMTPSRKGDDLYLSVSIATPQNSHFHELYEQR
ncbi:hypothetical protein Slin15195_G010440 [Septoria linicola]|uniref:Uncharacterized protein n=1 Tax=Septoria linicola TaxID=215465 RepID=A0A9Q9AJS6_9PEZI|nr:hypothetical protein Slin14017_G010450 [Septoria linicola]USW47725.1 hypothetical protein Slin15195_G010440 [Septoria linicola]